MKFRIVVFMTMLAVIATGLGWVSETAQAQATTKTHRLQILRYISPTANFTIGDTLTGDLSGATGIIRADNNSGSSGSLTLTDLVPGPTGDFFLDTELISDDTGADATVDGVLSSFTQCSFCHLLHGSPGGALNTADTFDNTCLTCHGSGSTEPNAPFPMQFHTNESCTNNCGERPFFLGCSTCHLPHANLENRLYDGGLGHENSLEHPHSQPNDCESGGGLVKCDGFNRKLVGTVYDGTRIAKIATPITVLTASWTGGVATMTLKVNNAPNAPPHTFMVGDRITVRDVWSTNNATGIFGLGFNGDFIVESVTNWDAVLEATITYKLATDPGTYQLNDLSSADPNTGMVQSTGWPVRPSVNNAGWTAGTATLALGGDHSIETGDAVSVTGVESAGNPTGDFNSGFNGVFTVTAVTGNDVSYLLAADPGAFQQS
ncbi:MAG: cytochrome c3 family protein, partial [Gammaproteobacteria bacterium]|nr:cytochrome c3 family protein [Gammaproteobacteria bacterium]